MGGAISKENKYTYKELCEIPREAILEHWIREDNETIKLIEEFIKSKYLGVSTENFPLPKNRDLLEINVSVGDIEMLRDYKEFLMNKVICNRESCHKEHETREIERSLEDILR